MWRILTNSSRMAALLGILLISLSLLSSCSVPTGEIEQLSPANGITVNVQVVTDQGGGVTILAPVMISGQGPFTFVVDTGASVSLIDRPVANRLGLPVSGDAQQVEGIGGVQTVIPVQISNWSLGKINLPATNIDKTSFASLELGGNAVGLLGSDIWNAFGEVTINYTGQTLTVYKQLSTS
ncbi:MAG: retropepsin-like aspartic protease [Ktedonobacterales bacterium]